MAASSSCGVCPGRAVASIAEHRAEHHRRLIGVHALRDLLLVDSFLYSRLERPCPSTPRGDVGVGVAVLEERRREPRHVHPRQLDAILDDQPALRRDGGVCHVDRRNGGPRFSEPKYFSTSFFVAALSMSPAIASVALFGRVILPEECLTSSSSRPECRRGSDDDTVVRMPSGKAS